MPCAGGNVVLHLHTSYFNVIELYQFVKTCMFSYSYFVAWHKFLFLQPIYYSIYFLLLCFAQDVYNIHFLLRFVVYISRAFESMSIHCKLHYVCIQYLSYHNILPVNNPHTQTFSEWWRSTQKCTRESDNATPVVRQYRGRCCNQLELVLVVWACAFTLSSELFDVLGTTDSELPRGRSKTGFGLQKEGTGTTSARPADENITPHHIPEQRLTRITDRIVCKTSKIDLVIVILSDLKEHGHQESKRTIDWFADLLY